MAVLLSTGEKSERGQFFSFFHPHPQPDRQTLYRKREGLVIQKIDEK
jgi:hypothetical protein